MQLISKQIDMIKKNPQRVWVWDLFQSCDLKIQSVKTSQSISPDLSPEHLEACAPLPA